MGIEDQIAAGAFESVTRAYAELTGKNRFWKPRKGALTEVACKEFVRLQFLLHLSTTQLMREAIAMYEGDWCMETFKSKYPPFTVVVGDKCRRRLIHNHKPRVPQTTASINMHAREIAANLKNLMGLDGALDIVADGWPHDERLRAAVFFSLKGVRDYEDER